jgi:hypothetical protein
MTRRDFLNQLNKRLSYALCEAADGAWAALDDEMTMADFGTIAIEVSRFGNEHRHELPMPKVSADFDYDR